MKLNHQVELTHKLPSYQYACVCTASFLQRSHATLPSLAVHFVNYAEEFKASAQDCRAGIKTS